MTTERRDPRSRVQQLLLESEERRRRIQEILSKRAPGPLPGDLYSFAVDVDAALLWAVVRAHVDDPDLLLVVPADTNPLAGTCDVRIPELAACGPLTLRSDRGSWITREGFDLGTRVGFLEDIYLAMVNLILERLASGRGVPGNAPRIQIDNAPEYRNWIGTVMRAGEHLQGKVSERASAHRVFPHRRVGVNPDQLRELIDNVRAFIYYGSTPEQAVERIAKMARLGAKEKEQLLAEYLREGEKYIELTDPTVLRGNRRIESWYTGPDFEGAWCWPAYKERLLKGDWSKEAINKLDESSTKILAHLSHPATKRFGTRGLVVGYVQSGKTANYSALIAKAADVGYKLFIVLAGTTSSLRQQTQGRLEDDILSNHKENWNRLTGPESDFGFFPGVAEAMLNPANKSGRILAVVKKNKFVLDKLKDFLGKANRDIIGACPVIVIDDEADNASVNTRAEERTAINKAIIEILRTLPKVAYIGYTATPFANIFIDPSVPEDLFPRDFIFDLPQPKGYFGTEKIFGRDLAWFDEQQKQFEGLDIVRRVTLDEQRGLQPPKASERETFEPTIPQSLKDAVSYFVMATACRYARGQDKHSSMLVHTSQYVSVHGQMQKLLQLVVQDLKRNWRGRKQAL